MIKPKFDVCLKLLQYFVWKPDDSYLFLPLPALRRRVQIGIVYVPMLRQMYTARRGQGAKLNGEPIHVR